MPSTLYYGVSPGELTAAGTLSLTDGGEGTAGPIVDNDWLILNGQSGAGTYTLGTNLTLNDDTLPGAKPLNMTMFAGVLSITDTAVLTVKGIAHYGAIQTAAGASVVCTCQLIAGGTFIGNITHAGTVDGGPVTAVPTGNYTQADFTESTPVAVFANIEGVFSVKTYTLTALAKVGIVAGVNGSLTASTAITIAGTLVGDASVNSAGTLAVTGTISGYSGTWQWGTDLTLNSTGQTLTPKRSNTATGDITITAGTLSLGVFTQKFNDMTVGGTLAMSRATLYPSGTIDGTGGTFTNTSAVVIGGTVNNCDLTGQTALLHLWPAAAGTGNTNVSELSPSRANMHRHHGRAR